MIREVEKVPARFISELRGKSSHFFLNGWVWFGRIEREPDLVVMEELG